MFSTTYGWENGPMKIIPTPMFEAGETDYAKVDQYMHIASEMALVHNCIIRAFNGIYNQARRIKPADFKSFVSYSYSCYQGLEAHHDGEEEYFFPWLEEQTGKKGIMDVNIAQHEAFHDGFGKWGAYLKSLNEGDATKFSGDECVAIMDTFIEPLSQHLHDEIPTLLALAEYGDKLDLLALMQKEGEKVMAGLSKTAQLPVFLLNHDVTFEGGIHNFPPIPPPVKWVLMRVFTIPNWTWWKFAACDTTGRPRPLYFGLS